MPKPPISVKELLDYFKDDMEATENIHSYLKYKSVLKDKENVKKLHASFNQFSYVYKEEPNGPFEQTFKVFENATDDPKYKCFKLYFAVMRLAMYFSSNASFIKSFVEKHFLDPKRISEPYVVNDAFSLLMERPENKATFTNYFPNMNFLSSSNAILREDFIRYLKKAKMEFVAQSGYGDQSFSDAKDDVDKRMAEMLEAEKAFNQLNDTHIRSYRKLFNDRNALPLSKVVSKDKKVVIKDKKVVSKDKKVVSKDKKVVSKDKKVVIKAKAKGPVWVLDTDKYKILGTVRSLFYDRTGKIKGKRVKVFEWIDGVKKATYVVPPRS